MTVQLPAVELADWAGFQVFDGVVNEQFRPVPLKENQPRHQTGLGLTTGHRTSLMDCSQSIFFRKGRESIR